MMGDGKPRTARAACASAAARFAGKTAPTAPATAS